MVLTMMVPWLAEDFRLQQAVGGVPSLHDPIGGSFACLENGRVVVRLVSKRAWRRSGVIGERPPGHSAIGLTGWNAPIYPSGSCEDTSFFSQICASDRSSGLVLVAGVMDKSITKIGAIVRSIDPLVIGCEAKLRVRCAVEVSSPDPGQPILRLLEHPSIAVDPAVVLEPSPLGGCCPRQAVRIFYRASARFHATCSRFACFARSPLPASFPRGLSGTWPTQNHAGSS